MDMNMYCSTDLSRCRCKEDMRWNKEELECQVGIIVNGSLGLISELKYWYFLLGVIKSIWF